MAVYLVKIENKFRNKNPVALVGAIFDVGKRRGDTRNIPAAITITITDLGIRRNSKVSLYHIVCPTNFLRIENISDYQIPLQSVAAPQSSKSGEGLIKRANLRSICAVKAKLFLNQISPFQVATSRFIFKKSICSYLIP